MSIDNRPEIKVTPGSSNTSVVERCWQLLALDMETTVRDSVLYRIISDKQPPEEWPAWKRAPDPTITVKMDSLFAMIHLSRLARFMVYDGKSKTYVQKAPPMDICRAVLKWGRCKSFFPG